MAERTVTVASKVGLHARPATLISQAAAKLAAAGTPVTIGLPGATPVRADSVLMLMTLGAAHGTQVVVASDSPEAVETIATMVETDLDAA